MEAGGEFSIKMRQLYEYFDDRLMHSNIHKEPQGIRDVIRLLNTLQEAWAQMLQSGRASQTTATHA